MFPKRTADSIGRSFLLRAAYAQDFVSMAGFYFGALLCGYIVVSLCYEVASRYLLGAPTLWANPFASFALCIAIFVALPEMTRRRSHVVVNILIDRLSPANAAILQKLIYLIGAVVCILTAWVGLEETWGQFQGGVQTMSAVELQKWPLTLAIAYGFLSAGIYFLREIANPPKSHLEEVA